MFIKDVGAAQVVTAGITLHFVTNNSIINGAFGSSARIILTRVKVVLLVSWEQFTESLQRRDVCQDLLGVVYISTTATITATKKAPTVANSPVPRKKH